MGRVDRDDQARGSVKSRSGAVSGGELLDYLVGAGEASV